MQMEYLVISKISLFLHSIKSNRLVMNKYLGVILQLAYFLDIGDEDETIIQISDRPSIDSSIRPYLFFSQNEILYRKEIDGYSIFDAHQLVHR